MRLRLWYNRCMDTTTVLTLLSITIPSLVAAAGIGYQYRSRRHDRRLAQFRQVLEDAYRWTSEVLGHCEFASDPQAIGALNTEKLVLSVEGLKATGKRVASAAADIDDELARLIRELVEFLEENPTRLYGNEQRVVLRTLCNKIRGTVADLRHL